MTIEALRTPEENFENLPDWDFEPNYIDTLPGYQGLRLAYLDEGPRDAPVFLCLHGQPSWSYLYRKMAPVFLAAGYRVVAPDLYGFGRSDKPVEQDIYTYHFHRNSLLAFVEALDLSDICLVCQDWGGLLGLTLPMEASQRYSRLLVMNTGLPAGETAGQGFAQWRLFNRSQPDLDLQALMQRATPILSEAEAAAYAAPFPDVRYKAGVRQFPELVMMKDSDDTVMDALSSEGIETSLKARKFWSEDWSGESFMAVGMQDPVLGPPAMQFLRSLIKNCPEPMKIADGGHFVQEWGAPIAKAALKQFAL